MKRIDAIVKGAGSLVSNIINRKSQRILRGVEQAIAFAEDKVDYYTDSSEELINSLAEVSGADDSSALASRINKYVENMGARKDWEETVSTLKDLKAKLNAEVKVDKSSEKPKKNEE